MNGEMIFEKWQNSLKSEHTKAQYMRAIRGLEEYTGKSWWLTKPTDMIGWQRYMKRDLHLSDATVAVRLSASSSLFSFGMRMQNGDGTAVCQVNPVLAVDRPDVQKFGKVGALDTEQIKALLRVIKQKISRSRGIRQVVHLRNFAMIEFYLFTAKRNEEVSQLRWGQIRRVSRFAGQPKKIEIQWNKKEEETKWAVLPEPVWVATWAYLQAAGRTNLQPDEYLFVPLEDPFQKVQAGSPITDRMARTMVNRYAKQAGLTRVTLQMLRHSSAMLLRAVDASVVDIQQHLGHGDINTTQIYLDQLSSHDNNHWVKVADMLGLTSNTLPNQEGNKKTMYRYPLNLRKTKRGVE